LTTEPLRYPDEFVRHKILDIIGDLSLAGRPITGHVVAVKPGHSGQLRIGRGQISLQMRKPMETAQKFRPPAPSPPQPDGEAVEVRDGEGMGHAAPDEDFCRTAIRF